MTRLRSLMGVVLVGSALLVGAAEGQAFGPSNPFYAKSVLPYQAPPFDKIKDEHYQPAIEAGMA